MYKKLFTATFGFFFVLSCEFAPVEEELEDGENNENVELGIFLTDEHFRPLNPKFIEPTQIKGEIDNQMFLSFWYEDTDLYPLEEAVGCADKRELRKATKISGEQGILKASVLGKWECERDNGFIQAGSSVEQIKETYSAYIELSCQEYDFSKWSYEDVLNGYLNKIKDCKKLSVIENTAHLLEVKETITPSIGYTKSVIDKVYRNYTSTMDSARNGCEYNIDNQRVKQISDCVHKYLYTPLKFAVDGIERQKLQGEIAKTYKSYGLQSRNAWDNKYYDNGFVEVEINSWQGRTQFIRNSTPKVIMEKGGFTIEKLIQ